jgi:hypothetical protein
VALGDHVCCVLVTLDSCHHLDNLELLDIRRVSLGDCAEPPDGGSVRGFVLILAGVREEQL